MAPAWKRNLRRQGAGLIHAHFAPDGLMALPIAEYLDIPLIVTFQGYGVTTKDEHARKSFYRQRKYIKNRNKVFSKVNKFIAVSNYIKKKAVEQGCNESKIEVIYTGIDTDLFKPSRIGGRDRIVLFVGRIVEKKGLKYLIRAMESVEINLEKSIKLLVIGDGKRREELEREASKRLENVEFIGFQTQKVVRKWMNRAMMLAVPSVEAESGDSEGLPNVVFEGQAMGLPVIGSNHAGIPEAISHGETGFIFREKEWKEMEKYITLVAKNESMRKDIGKKARSMMIKKFNIKKQSKKIENIYDSFVN
jgi:glycosyltransferase involved in cell wall biosynthesis